MRHHAYVTGGIVGLGALIAAAALLAHCGPKKGTLAPQSPWKAELAEHFDDSVDFTLNPESLSGQWLYKYQHQLGRRIEAAELILGVKVVSVTQNTDPEGRQCKDLSADVNAAVKGTWQEGSLTLRVCDDAAGFDSFKEGDPRLFERVFIAFVKLYKKPDGEIGKHWHLSPLSQGLKEGMDAILNKGDKPVEKTYVYPNE